jgi:hypothetical protein
VVLLEFIWRVELPLLQPPARTWHLLLPWSQLLQHLRHLQRYVSVF